MSEDRRKGEWDRRKVVYNGIVGCDVRPERRKDRISDEEWRKVFLDAANNTAGRAESPEYCIKQGIRAGLRYRREHGPSHENS